MIYGIGTDIVRIARIEALHARHDERFARRVLGPDELAEFHRRLAASRAGPGRAIRYIATRFAVKEAFSKALGLGLRHPMTLLSLQTLNDPRGRPYCVPRLALAPYLAERGLTAHVTLSDEFDAAIAFVVIEQSGTAPETAPAPAPATT